MDAEHHVYLINMLQEVFGSRLCHNCAVEAITLDYLWDKKQQVRSECINDSEHTALNWKSLLKHFKINIFSLPRGSFRDSGVLPSSKTHSSLPQKATFIGFHMNFQDLVGNRRLSSAFRNWRVSSVDCACVCTCVCEWMDENDMQAYASILARVRVQAICRCVFIGQPT